MNKSWFIIGILFLVMACGEDNDCPAVPNVQLELSYESLVDQIHDVKD